MFPYNSSISSNQYNRDTPTADQRYQVVTMPQPIDVSAMEVESHVVDGLAGNASHHFSLGVEDGDATGTGTTDIDTAVGGSAGWTADTPKTHTMSTSAADLDADDWINLSYDETGTPGSTGGIGVNINFVYGVPGGIG